MNLLPELIEYIFSLDIYLIIISQFINKQISNIMHKKFSYVDKNLFLNDFIVKGHWSEFKWKANKKFIVIKTNNPNIHYIDELTENCFLISTKEYLRIMDKNYGRVAFIYKDICSGYDHYINPIRMFVKSSKWSSHVLTDKESLNSIYKSKTYLEAQFITLSSKKDLFDFK